MPWIIAILRIKYAQMRTILVTIESSRSSGRRLLRGIAKYARFHGPWSFCWEPRGLAEIVAAAGNSDVDGIITRDAYFVDERLLRRIPTILVRHNRKESPKALNVITDCHKAARMAVDHFIERGLKNFAFCGYNGIVWAEERQEVFSRRLKEMGFKTHVHNGRFPEGAHQSERERERLVRWLKSLPNPIGLMGCNDDRCQHIVRACKEASLRIPDDIAIIGVDNDELVCELSDPPLSSVSLNFEKAGFEAASQLDRLMKGEPDGGGNIVVQATHIVTRKSTDFTAVDDPEIAKALSFIRRHFTEAIGVEDVVETAALSRRVLEKRFRQLLNRSVLEEIRQVRTNHIAQMLVETNESILEIALALGFQDSDHISRYFRKETGMSLRQYRQKYGRK